MHTYINYQNIDYAEEEGSVIELKFKGQNGLFSVDQDNPNYETIREKIDEMAKDNEPLKIKVLKILAREIAYCDDKLKNACDLDECQYDHTRNAIEQLYNEIRLALYDEA